MGDAMKFKAKLIELPKVKSNEKEDELENLGSFTVGKRYLIYDIFSSLEFTDFLVADDTGVFYWINMSIFRK